MRPSARPSAAAACAAGPSAPKPRSATARRRRARGAPPEPEEPQPEPEEPPAPEEQREPLAETEPEPAGASRRRVRAPDPRLGPRTGEEVRWHAAGEGALPNGHVEIWGSSGAGKTQFTKSLLAQLAAHSGAHFGIADFKNDYGGDFPALASAQFIDLWGDGAPYNPLALPDDSDRAIQRAVIELRDIVDVATQSFARMGVRQKAKLKDALEEAYRIGRQEQRWPTLLTLNSLLDDDLRHHRRSHRH